MTDRTDQSADTGDTAPTPDDGPWTPQPYPARHARTEPWTDRADLACGAGDPRRDSSKETPR